MRHSEKVTTGQARKNFQILILLVSSAFLSASGLSASGNAQQAIPVGQPSPTPRVVELNVLFTDSSQHSVDDVKAEEVDLFESKLPQKMLDFTKQDLPVDYAIAIDNSGSFKTLLPIVVEMAKTLVNTQRIDDELFLERFTNAAKIETVQEFTSDKTKLFGGLDALYIEGGQSAVVDAIYLAVQHVAGHGSKTGRRRAVVVFTDGEDRQSYYNEKELLELIKTSDVQVFAIGITAQLDETSIRTPSQKEKAEQLLTRIAKESGGRVFFSKNRKELIDAVQQVAHDLHIQYTIKYESTVKTNQNFRIVEVKANTTAGSRKLTAFTRPGYYVNPPAPKEKNTKSK